MRIRQTSVFMERALERFKEITELFNEAGINIRAHSLVGHSNTPYKILRMIVDDTDQAVTVLKNRGLSVKTDEVVAIEVDDRTGGLYRILTVLEEEGLELKYTYAAVHCVSTKAAMIFKFEDLDRAARVLADHNIVLFAAEEL
ncbi:MAG: amino acid-binding protein [Desulfosarcina sp.]|nr:amino acid-binding protein [Desulfobacterales bacterium]